MHHHPQRGESRLTFRYHAAVCNSMECRAVHLARHESALASYAYPRHIEALMRLCFGTPEMIGRGHLIVDSGAFTAHAQGQRVDVHEYGEYCVNFANRHGEKLAGLEFMNLDVIGNQPASDEHHRILQDEYGLNPMPVFTYGAPLATLERMAAQHPRLALGGLVPLSREVDAVEAWLRRCFDALHGAEVRVHLLGIGRASLLHDFPVASCDSGSFSRRYRFDRRESSQDTHPTLSGPDLKVRALADELARLQALERAVNDRRPHQTYRPSDQPALFPA